MFSKLLAASIPAVILFTACCSSDDFETAAPEDKKPVLKKPLFPVEVASDVVVKEFIIRLLDIGHAPADPDERNIEVNSDLLTKPVTIELISINGMSMPEASLNASLAIIRRHVAGPVKVVKGEDVEIEFSETGYSGLLELKSALKGRRFKGPGTVTIAVSPTFGLTYLGYCSSAEDGSRVIVLFPEIIKRQAVIAVLHVLAFEMVLTHEFGHALGIPSGKWHRWGGSHCTNPECVVYRNPDRRAILRAILHLGPYTDFCETCTAELRAAKIVAERKEATEKTLK
ncbi:MAG: zinc metalloprotease [Planctomycetota bacterium]|jgi:hypothetical protein